ncbi:PREDICTED: uncharacterized protein LOC102844288 [Elephantulus edwardii]|uniref:uncharacterized protein LOC102844288 n=1 Tax=Elephantulus edwardii TaxID=28737 RepID=UPI0003F05DCE|nr:PREDICTED: uncharacterized protein LOC102844288 [Elephantulus edwardii]
MVIKVLEMQDILLDSILYLLWLHDTATALLSLLVLVPHCRWQLLPLAVRGTPSCRPWDPVPATWPSPPGLASRTVGSLPTRWAPYPATGLYLGPLRSPPARWAPSRPLGPLLIFWALSLLGEPGLPIRKLETRPCRQLRQLCAPPSLGRAACALSPQSHPFPTALLPDLPPMLSLALASGSHSLCYNFTIMLKSPPARSWCAVQGQVDEDPFCHYDCGNLKMVNVSLLGKKINAMKEGEEQTQTLRDIGAELRQRVPGIELENYSPRAPVTLQARMCCQLEAGGDTTASWQLGFDGQIFLQFDPKTMKWTQVHPGGRRMKEAWEKDRGLSIFLKRTSEGDCRLWLRALGAHRKETLELTVLPWATQHRPTFPKRLRPAAKVLSWEKSADRQYRGHRAQTASFPVSRALSTKTARHSPHCPLSVGDTVACPLQPPRLRRARLLRTRVASICLPGGFTETYSLLLVKQILPAPLLGDPKTCTFIDRISRDLLSTPRSPTGPLVRSGPRDADCGHQAPSPVSAARLLFGGATSRMWVPTLAPPQPSRPALRPGVLLRTCRAPVSHWRLVQVRHGSLAELPAVPASHPFPTALWVPRCLTCRPSCASALAPGFHSLCYNFTIMLKSPSGRSWCQVQGQVDEEPFCHYDCGNLKMVNVSLLGKKINAMKEGEEQTQTLRDIGAELRQRVPDIELENYSSRAPAAAHFVQPASRLPKEGVTGLPATGPGRLLRSPRSSAQNPTTFAV